MLQALHLIKITFNTKTSKSLKAHSQKGQEQQCPHHNYNKGTILLEFTCYQNYCKYVFPNQKLDMNGLSSHIYHWETNF